MNPTEIYLGLAVFALTALLGIYTLQRRNLDLVSLFALFFGSYLGLAPLLSFFAGNRTFPFPSNALFLTYASFFIFIVALFGTKLFFETLRKEPNRNPNFTTDSLTFLISSVTKIPYILVVSIFVIVVALRLEAFASGGGISGLHDLEYLLNQNYLIVVISHLASPLTSILYFYCFATFLQKKQSLYKIAVIMLPVLLIFSFLSGRREFLMPFLLFLLCALALKPKIQWRYIIGGLAVVAFFFSVISPIFLSMRSAAQTERHIQVDGSSLDLLRHSIEEVRAQDRFDQEDRSRANIAARLLMFRSVPMQLFTAQELRPPMLGRAFFQASTSALPRFLRPFEAWYNPQTFVQENYNLPVHDVSYSVLSQFIADFGIFGAVLGGVFLGLFFKIGTALSVRYVNRYPIPLFALFFSLAEMAFSPEINPAVLFNLPRNVILLSILYFFYKRVTKTFANSLVSDEPFIKPITNIQETSLIRHKFPLNRENPRISHRSIG
ncbi:MAG: hypothetical protein LAT55_08235 [Opitutales bacterium]|nr:hypothetical protein [Opitutales bacterium]